MCAYLYMICICARVCMSVYMYCAFKSLCCTGSCIRVSGAHTAHVYYFISTEVMAVHPLLVSVFVCSLITHA